MRWPLTARQGVTDLSPPGNGGGRSTKGRRVAYDVDLLRELMFSLEERQQSPRATVVLSLADEAVEFGRTPAEIDACLGTLLQLEYIDGAGREDDTGYWFFRKLTRKGVQFVRATREPRDWERIKRRFGGPQVSPT